MPSLVEELRSAPFAQRPPTETVIRPNALGRARVAALATLAAFAAVQLVVALIMESGPDRDPIYSVRLTRLRKQQHAVPEKSLTVVMLGTSRTECALRSVELRELLKRDLERPVAVGNFGLSGCGYPMCVLTWNRLQHDGVRPDFVLIEALPEMLNENWGGNDLAEARFPLFCVRHCDLDVIERSFPEARPGLRREWLLAWPNPLYTQRLNFVGRFAPNLLPANQRWWSDQLCEDEPITAPPLAPERRRQALKQARQEYATKMQNFRLGGCGYAALRELLRRVREAGVPAALVILPEGPEFQSWYAPGAYQLVRDTLDQFATEFGVGVLDLHDGLSEDDFVDSHHLTPPSAAKFTARLGSEKLLPLLRKQVAACGLADHNR